jgi:hypothetical protein
VPGGTRLLVKLPVHPSTIEELALIRFWLLKFSMTHFEYLNACTSILNPEYLSAINPRVGSLRILFHVDHVTIKECGGGIPTGFAQFLCAREITLYSALFENHRDDFLKFITGMRNTPAKLSIYSYMGYHGEFCCFLIKV